ncbi:hypothetical protein Y032_0087g2071 [Ancylostoma ceylanicum]|uniref:Uncharacterized protein n=1 Tax=Ancylostoma ceylanicum TaxID=53326 RepID=A0A016TPD2_9BILA|nr:hypothetical protein Y032_0087g2071 [Ancylostoma ceylanicum]
MQQFVCSGCTEAIKGRAMQLYLPLVRSSECVQLIGQRRCEAGRRRSLTFALLNGKETPQSIDWIDRLLCHHSYSLFRTRR